MLFIHLNEANSFCLICLPYIVILTLNVASAINKMTVNEVRDFIYENYYKRIGFAKESSYYSMKHLKKRFIID